MNLGGDAVDQSTRIVLEGTEIALRLTGTAAKHIAVMLYTVLSSPKQTKGKIGLTKMLKTGKPLEAFSIRNADVAAFVKAAKEYGITYYAVRERNGSPDGTTSFFVYRDDASRLNNMIDRYGFATVKQHGSIEMEASRETMQPAEKEGVAENPLAARTGPGPRSEPSSPIAAAPARDLDLTLDRPPVRAELEAIRRAQQEAEQKKREHDPRAEQSPGKSAKKRQKSTRQAQVK